MSINAEMMPFKKYVQSKRILYHEDIIKVSGTFKEKPSGKVVKGDTFNAHRLGNFSLKDIYKTYLEWFNHTRTKDEDEREFISVEKVEAQTVD